MTFKDVTIKIFKARIRRYLAYFLCNSFTIMIFFMYSSILFNTELSKEISRKYSNGNIRTILNVPIIVIVLFSILFISYAYSSFIKSRNSEFGLFLSLGMSHKDIRKIVLFENGVIGLSSIVLGLLSGAVFSRLFFLIIVRILSLEDINFSLNYQSFLVTILVFMVIFILVILSNKFSNRKLDIPQLIKDYKKSEKLSAPHPLLGVAGLVLIIGSLILLKLHMEGYLFPDEDYFMLISVFASISGLYLVINQISGIILSIYNANKSIYYKNLINICEIRHSIRQNKKILFTVTLLATMFIFFIGLAYSLYTQTLNISIRQTPHHISFVEYGNTNRISTQELNRIVNNGQTPLTDEKTIEFIFANTLATNNGKENSQLVAIMGNDEFNRSFKKDLSIVKEEAITVTLFPGDDEPNKYFADTTEIKTDKKLFNIKIIKNINDRVIDSNTFLMPCILVVSNNLYEELKSNLLVSNIGKLHYMDFKDWRKTGTIIDTLEKKLDEANNYEKDFFSLHSRLGMYKEMKMESSLLLFLMSFIGIVFFFASGCILYLKIFTDINKMKFLYIKLFNLGIMDREMIKIISSELKLLFFSPLFFGCIIGLSYINIINVAGVGGNSVFDGIFIFVAYLATQILFYCIAKSKYTRKIIDTLS